MGAVLLFPCISNRSNSLCFKIKLFFVFHVSTLVLLFVYFIVEQRRTTSSVSWAVEDYIKCELGSGGLHQV